MTSVAIVHEWLGARAGSEKTFEQMSQVLPDADVYALTVNRDVPFEIAAPVRSTALQRVPPLRDRRALSLPIMPLAWRAMRTPRYDTVITSAHAFARYFPAARHANHLSYVYTPLRYAWLPGVDGRGSSRAMAPARAVLRAVDRRSISHVTSFAGISNAVRERIEEFYDREATVVFPPVDTEFFADESDREESDADELTSEPYVLGVSRWIPYKRLDLVIDAGSAVGLPVVIAGDGPDEPALRAAAERAKVPVRFERRPDDQRLRALYRSAAAMVFPPDEDFGIIPLEAQAAGTPVVALASGGSLDTVADGVTGALVPTQTTGDMAAGIERAMALDSPRDAYRDHVAQFSIDAFRRGFREWIAPWVTA